MTYDWQLPQYTPSNPQAFRIFHLRLAYIALFPPA